MSTPPHPMQPILLDEDQRPRFKENAIVRYLLNQVRDNGISSLSSLADLPFSSEDRSQFAQLIGYSLAGFSELPYANPAIVEEAERIADLMRGVKQETP